MDDTPEAPQGQSAETIAARIAKALPQSRFDHSGYDADGNRVAADAYPDIIAEGIRPLVRSLSTLNDMRTRWNELGEERNTAQSLVGKVGERLRRAEESLVIDKNILQALHKAEKSRLVFETECNTLKERLRVANEENASLTRNWRNEQDQLSAEQIKAAEVEERLRVAEEDETVVVSALKEKCEALTESLQHAEETIETLKEEKD